jgi:hypothetical protein
MRRAMSHSKPEKGLSETSESMMAMDAFSI